MTDATAGISALASENRIFPPSESTKRDALVTGTWMYDEAAEDYQGFWAKPGGRAARLGRPSGTPSASGSCRSPSGSSAARPTSPTTASTATWPPAGATRPPSSGRASPATPARHLRRPARRGLALRQRAEGARHPSGDRVNIYMPMVPELPIAMLACAADRRAALRDLRRVLAAGARRPQQRRRGQGADHRRRRLAARRRCCR